jgi:hypothetical protein
VEQAAQAMKDGASADTSLDVAPQADIARLASDARHQARRLANTLAALPPDALEQLDRTAATSLANELLTVRQAIAGVLDPGAGQRP